MRNESYPLSIVSLVAGILGFVVFWVVVWIPIVGGVLQLLIAAAAVVLGFLARGRETTAPRGMWIAGIVLGFFGVVIGLISIIVWIALLATNS